MSLWAWGMLLFAMSAGITFVVQRSAVRWGYYDHPGERSSHTVPTPRLGGIGIAVATLVGWLGMPPAPDAAGQMATPILAGGAVAAIVGLVDDLKGLSPSAKFAGETLAVLVPLWAFPFNDAGPMRWIALAACAFWMLAYTNFFNFMDGTDGLAGGVTVIAALGLASLAGRADADAAQWMALAIAAAAAGFLVFNYPPATIFMGDTGSLFLGYSLGILVLLLDFSGVSMVAAALVLSPFLFDATYTLAVRARRNDVLWRAHRSHLYQRLIRTGASHLRVAMLYWAWTMLATALGWAWVTGPILWRLCLIVISMLPGVALIAYVHRRERPVHPQLV